jgi:hypothetical protein
MAEQHLMKNHLTISAIQFDNAGVSIEDFANEEEVVRPDHLIQALVDHLGNYKWCSCRVCLLHYKMFLQHIKTSHTSSKMKLEVETNPNPPIRSKKSEKRSAIKQEATIEIPTSKVVAIEDPNFDYFSEFIVEDVALSSEEEQGEHSMDVKSEIFNYEYLDLSCKMSPEVNLNQKQEATIDEVMDSTQTGSPNDKPPTPATSKFKKLFFKVGKVGDENFYKCSACQKKMTYADIIEHGKEHTADKPKQRFEIKTKTVKKPILTQPLLPSINAGVTEFQCGLCEEIYQERAAVYICLKNHEQEGWVSNKSSYREQQSIVVSKIQLI